MAGPRVSRYQKKLVDNVQIQAKKAIKDLVPGTNLELKFMLEDCDDSNESMEFDNSSLNNEDIMYAAMDKVEGNEDMLRTILIRLPKESIFALRLVSKRWHNILSDIYRCTINRKIFSSTIPIIAVFRTTRELAPPSRAYHPQPSFIHILSLVDSNNKIEPIQDKFGYFIHSCRKLILCGYHHRSPRAYYVYNPLNRMSYSLPPLPPTETSYGIPLMALACEEENACGLITHFKVISVVLSSTPQNAFTVQIYSTRTGKWAYSRMVGIENFMLCTVKPPFVSYNNIIHLYTQNWSLALYDCHDEESTVNVQLIPLPNVKVVPKKDTYDLTKSCSSNALWFCFFNPSESMTFWMLPPDNDISPTKRDWILTYTVISDSLLKDCIKLLSPTRKFTGIRDNIEIYFGLLCKMDMLVSLNGTFMVVCRVMNFVFIYNLETDSCVDVSYDGSSIIGDYGWHHYGFFD